jgi:hypothetical protein
LATFQQEIGDVKIYRSWSFLVNRKTGQKSRSRPTISTSTKSGKIMCKIIAIDAAISEALKVAQLI